MNQELEALIKIKSRMTTKAPYIWRYATGVGDISNADEIEVGWFLED